MNPTPNMAAAPQPAAVVASDGVQLEAEVSWPAEAAAVAVLSHPHPLYGGDMWNPLIDHLFRTLPAAGIAALRYNFRGTGSSGGSHDHGKAEQLDAAAAFDAAVRLAAGQSGDVGSPAVVSAGWSFGGDVSLAADHDGMSAWIGIAAPLRIVDPADMAAPADPRPKLLLVPQHDQFRSPTEASAIASGWTHTRLEVIAGGDHFLMGHARAVAEHILAFAHGL
ncbi:alpha/beta hydrolase [Candidatus Poriferisodalis sp.]|uniref:alpha/beta hydrolase n=1 Tax=Candidatus Poriferisodalis sp. TaxID=3101277 RepID=UPI003B01DEB1